MIRAIAIGVVCVACEKAVPSPSPEPTPIPQPTPVVDAGTVDKRSGCDAVSLRVDDKGIWIGAAPNTRCFAPRNAGELDIVWLEAELSALRKHLEPCDRSDAELAAAGGTQYQDLIAVMDRMVAAGFKDVGLSSPSDLSVAFPATPPTTATHCGTPTIAKPLPDPVGSGAPNIRPPTGRTTLQNAPVIIITRDAIVMNGRDLVTVADANAKTGTIGELADALGKPTADGLAILQADAATPAKVINRVVETAKKSGYDNLLFAVKNR